MARKSRKKSARSRREILKSGLKDEVAKSIKRNEQRRKGFSIVSGDDATLWKPKQGSHIIDIIPYVAGDADPSKSAGSAAYTLTYFVHRRVGPNNENIICLEAMKQGKCTICEHRQRLREAGENDDKWKPLFPKERNLYNIICYDMNEEQKGIQIWDESEFYSQRNIASIAKEKGRGGAKDRKINFVDPDNGKSISFEVQPPVSRDDFPKYIGFKFQRRGYKIKDELLDNALTLDQLIEYPTEEEVEETYWGEHGERDVEPDEDHEEGDTATDEEEEYDSPYELLEDATTIGDLKDIAEDFDIEIKILNKWSIKKAKRLLKTAIDEQWGDEDDEDEEEESEYTAEEIRDMTMRQLKRLNRDEDLGLSHRDYDDEEDFAEGIIEELELE